MAQSPQLISLKHASGLQLDLMDYGATWLSCKVPLHDGNHRETLLGRPNAAAYATQNAYMGAMIGRFSNRIGHAKFELDGRDICLQKIASEAHQLHGGPAGFNTQFWTLSAQSEIAATYTLHSPDGDQGFPGALNVAATVTLSGPQQITLRIMANCNKKCPVSITHHPYFNLDAQQVDVRRHALQIHADKFLPVDATMLPIGALHDVTDPFDFRHSRAIGGHWLSDLQQQRAGGYDHAYLLKAIARGKPAATLTAADKKLSLKISTTLPALQLYTGQFLSGIVGRDGHAMPACTGVALEPQFLPDSPNHPEWPQPSCWLTPEEIYDHTIRYDFIASA